MESKQQNTQPSGEEKLIPGNVTERSAALQWLDNFWYYHKWKVIVSAFFLTVLVIGLVQIFKRDAYDVTVTLSGSYRMNSEERTAFVSLLNDICPEDYDGDGKKSVNLVEYQVYSEDEYQAEQAKAEAESDRFQINAQYNSNEYENFHQYVITGESSILLVSPYLFEELVASDRLMPMAELYGDDPLPKGTADDGYGIRLADTDFYIYHPAAQVLPDTTIMCFLRATAMGNASHEDQYSRSKATFRAVADWHVLE